MSARDAISENRTTLTVSAISAFEIALKHRKRRLDLGMEPAAWWSRAISHHGLTVQPITDEIALASAVLPPLHADPCDRMIVATAERAGASVVTSDELIRQYSTIQVVW